MTPEFRQAVYRFRHQPRLHGRAQDCIPLQLQMLFARLQLESRAYQDTVALTRSFQWEGSEAWEQCDVQEFCRVLFDAIELSVKHTPELTDLIGDLFSGEVRSGVECQTCGFRSCSLESFLDLSLCIDDPGIRTLEDALHLYFKPELLTGDNSYFCSYCARKTNAVRSQFLAKAPYILFLHLKRFTLDHRTLTRCKVNKEVQFPFLLDISPFIQSETAGESNQKAADQLYELYSVLVHAGSAMGGHYSAYILGFKERRWYLFNDGEVREAEEMEIIKTFGDSLNSNAQLYTGSSAYVLCYRRISPSNLHEVRSVPEHITEALQSDQSSVPLLESASEAALKVQLHYRHQMVTLELPEDETLSQVLRIAKMTYGLDAVSEENVRLRSFDMETGCALETFDPRDQRSLRNLRLGNLQALEVEVKESERDFEDMDTLELLVYSWNEACWEPDKPISAKVSPTTIVVHRNCLIADLLFRLSSLTCIPIELLCVLTSEHEYLSSPNYHLNTVSEVLKSHSPLYIEMLPESNAESHWERELTCDRHRLVVHYVCELLQKREEIMVDDRISVQELVRRIEKEGNVDLGKMCIRRNGEEVVDMEETLQKLADGKRELTLELDSKPPADRINLTFVKVELGDGDVCYHFTPLCQLSIPEQASCLSVQQALLSKLPYSDLRPEQLLLRPRIGQRLCRPFRPYDTFKTCRLYDQRNFGVQLFSGPAPLLAPDEVLILIKTLQNGRFTGIQEFPVLQHLTLEDFGALLSLRTGLDQSLLQVAKVGIGTTAAEAKGERWVQLAGRGFQILSESPWFVGPDGSFFL